MCMTPICVSTHPLVQIFIQYTLPMQRPLASQHLKETSTCIFREKDLRWGWGDLPGTLGSILGTRSCWRGKGRSMSVCRVVATEPAYRLCLLPSQRSCHCPPLQMWA